MDRTILWKHRGTGRQYFKGQNSHLSEYWWETNQQKKKPKTEANRTSIPFTSSIHWGTIFHPKYFFYKSPFNSLLDHSFLTLFRMTPILIIYNCYSKKQKKDQLKGWPKAQHSFQCYYVALEDCQFSHKSCYKSFQYMFSFCSYHRILPSCIISAVEPECSWRRQCCINS